MIKQNFIKLFNKCAKNYSNKIALKFFNEIIKYKDLDQKSNTISEIITSSGINRNSPIVLEVDKSIETVIYIIGIIKAGCFYIPIDSKSPEKRNQYIINNSKAVFGFTRKGSSCIEHLLKNKCEIQKTKYIGNSDFDISLLNNSNETENIFCCLYTSGSTGHPKGVLTSHEGMSTFLHEIKECMPVDSSFNCLNTAPFIFDVSLIDVFYPLTVGATVILSPEILIKKNMLSLIENEKIDSMCGVSSTINLIFQNSEDLKEFDLERLKIIMTGAEILNKKTLGNIFKKSKGVKIINGYGLTETTCVVLYFLINFENYELYSSYPIGKPLKSTKIKIHPTNEEIGELLISGPQILIGYLNDDQKTHDTIVDIDGVKYLKTGDLVKFDKNNDCIYLGRSDTQIKHNGYKIDLNQIKIRILETNLVKDVEVLYKNKRINAVVTVFNVEDKTKVIDKIYKELQKSLPQYMLPKNWGILEVMPKLKTGKTDLKILMEYIED